MLTNPVEVSAVSTTWEKLEFRFYMKPYKGAAPVVHF
jgi:hypothetical protein